MIKLHKEFKDDVQVLSVNPINPDGRIKAEISRFNLPFPVLSGRGSRIVVDYEVRGLPKIIIIDKQGLVVKVAGYLPPEELKQIVTDLIKKDKPADS